MQFRYCHQFRDFTPHINQTEIDQSPKFSDVKSFFVCDTANNEISSSFGGRKAFYLKVVLDANGHYRNNSKTSKVCENDVTVAASNGTFAVWNSSSQCFSFQNTFIPF